MISSIDTLSIGTADFAALLPATKASGLLTQLDKLLQQDWRSKPNKDLYDCDYLYNPLYHHTSCPKSANDEEQATTELIEMFNTLFAKQHVQLIRGQSEPEYFPAKHNQPARIEFAHGFFASALHEISHWCIAGDARRQLNDFGYWYAPDGRTAAQQQAFERVEIKPQAIECLFTLACQRSFQVSEDNLFADFDTSSSTFAGDVYQQAKKYIVEPHLLPRDAQILLYALLKCSVSQF